MIGFNNNNGTSVPTENVEFSNVLNFSTNKYMNEHEQIAHILFTDTDDGEKFNVVFAKIKAHKNYSISFDTNFVSYRSDLDNLIYGVYNIWFTKLPDGIIAYSIIKVGIWSPPVVELPFEANIVARYSNKEVELDSISGKISRLINSYNNSFDFFQSDDNKRPSIIDNAVVMSEENLMTPHYPGKLYVDSLTWNVSMLVEIEPVMGQTHYLLNSSTDAETGKFNTLTFKSKDICYINNQIVALGSYVGREMLRHIAGVHMVTLDQTATDTRFYLDGNLIATKSTGMCHLTLGSFLSQYNESAPAGILRFFDILVYNISLSPSNIETLQVDLEERYPNHKRSDAPVISGFATVGIATGDTLYTGDTINIDYDISGGTAVKLAVIWLSGGGTLSAFTVHNTAKSFVIPNHSDITKTETWFEIYVIDANGRASNSLEYEANKFTIINAV